MPAHPRRRRGPAAPLVVAALSAAGACAVGVALLAPATRRRAPSRSAALASHATWPRPIEARRRVVLAAAGDAVEGSEDADTTNVELFRQSLMKGWGGGTLGQDDALADWAQILDQDSLRAGDVLLASPASFVGDEGDGAGPRRAGFSGFLPNDFGGYDLLRNLPVILLTKVSGDGSAEGVWLTRRTGKLMGDYVDGFYSRPLFLGGPTQSPLRMVHPYPQVSGAEPLGEEGLYIGGDFAEAQRWVEDGEGSSLRFRFFLNQVSWSAGDLASEGAAWIPVRCSMDLVLSEADAMDEKPIWLQIAELAGGSAEEAARRYGMTD